jgi:hypothetical protein
VFLLFVFFFSFLLCFSSNFIYRHHFNITHTPLRSFKQVSFFLSSPLTVFFHPCQRQNSSYIRYHYYSMVASHVHLCKKERIFLEFLKITFSIIFIIILLFVICKRIKLKNEAEKQDNSIKLSATECKSG